MLKRNFYGEVLERELRRIKEIKEIKELQGERGTAAAETASRQ